MKTGTLVATDTGGGTIGLCFQENFKLRFARIVLYKDPQDCASVKDDAHRTAEEICRRWNVFSSLKAYNNELPRHPFSNETIKMPDFEKHGRCPHCDNGHSLEPDETCETCQRYNATDDRLCNPIPIKAAKKIANAYGYDQVVIIARCVGNRGGEHVTTYGKNPEHCTVAAKIGDFIKFKLMKWESEGTDTEQAEPVSCVYCTNEFPQSEMELIVDGVGCDANCCRSCFQNVHDNTEPGP